jgi:hypothetical protein
MQLFYSIYTQNLSFLFKNKKKNEKKNLSNNIYFLSFLFIGII